MPDYPMEDPFEWFARWFDEARQAEIIEPTAMTLATADAQGQPTARIVLLKSFDRKGFVFYTNCRSRKGQELAENPRVGLNFYWAPLARQVRIDGTAERVSDEEADEYFATRPRGSQIGAWASLQSAPLESREALMERIAHFEEKYLEAPVPRPAHWSGYRVTPHRIEFWEAGDWRLHDRWTFTCDEPGGPWTLERLFP